MQSAKGVGKTIEEAKLDALRQLGAEEKDVTFAVLEEGKNAFLGLFGGKDFEVEATITETPEFCARTFLTEVTGLMGIPAQIRMQSGDGLYIEMSGAHMGTLIGHRGETLDALQYLTSVVVNRKSVSPLRVTLDTEDYRKRREETLVRLGEKMASKAYRTGRRVSLEPMNPYERRVLHSSLQENENVTTHSEGEEPNRHVVIVPK